MKVALVYPEVYDIAKYGKKRKEFPPFGVMYLAAVLERTGYAPTIFKVNSDHTRLDMQEFEMVGFSIPSSVTYPLIREVRRESQYQSNAVLVAGGVHVNIYPKETLFDLDLDVVAVGEGDETIVELAKACSSQDFSQVKGIYYRKGDDIIFTGTRPLIANIDSLPFPARHLMDTNDIIMDDRLALSSLRMTHIMLSRGCPFSCHFCADPQKKVQFRSGQSVRRELIHLIDQYSIQGFSVVDDNSIINKQKLFDICQSTMDLNLKWNTVSRVDTIDRNSLRIMHKSGCIEIAFGMESGSNKILRSMNKGITSLQIETAIRMTYSEGIGVKVFLIHGFPGENMDSTLETIDLLEKLHTMIQRVSVFRFVPLPGSYVHTHPRRYRLRINPYQDFESIDWRRYHIHHNHYHWWGTNDDFQELNAAYDILREYVQNTWDTSW